MANIFLVLDRDRTDEAYASFIKCRAEDPNDIDEVEAREEFNHLHAQIIHERNNAVSLKHMFTNPGLRKRCIIGFLTLFGGQVTGTQVFNSK